MLLDVYVLKQGLLELPVLNTDPPVPPPALYFPPFQIRVNCRYVKFVSKMITKIETILKLILTAKDPPAGLVQNYFFLIADKSVTNFLKVLELKVHTCAFFSGSC
jgi:vacuolar protein sorting-associated protein 53